MPPHPENPSDFRHKRLPRLAEAAYRGHSCVHWVMGMDERRRGWLDAEHHARLREIILHACCRSQTLCPAYCLMPDHAHFVVLGIAESSDARTWSRMLRLHWGRLLSPAFRLQRQAYDHILRQEERTRMALATALDYILQNPIRAGLVPSASQWPYSGTIVPGYPSLHPHDSKFWHSFWLAHEALAK